jgi:hypothetical protein
MDDALGCTQQIPNLSLRWTSQDAVTSLACMAAD